MTDPTSNLTLVSKSIAREQRNSSRLRVNKHQVELGGGVAARRLWSTVRRALRSKGLKPSDVSDAWGVSRSTISRSLSAPSNMTIDKAGRIARTAGFYLTIDLEPIDGAVAEDCEVHTSYSKGVLRVAKLYPDRLVLHAEMPRGPTTAAVRMPLLSSELRQVTHSPGLEVRVVSEPLQEAIDD